MKRILVVEDNAHLRQIYAKLLYYNGFDVLAAATAGAGIDVARSAHPDAIVMDYILPDMDGIAATTVLHAAPDTSCIPVICISSYDVPRDKAEAAGCNSVLRKPVNGYTLVRAIRHEIGWDDGGDTESHS